MFDFAQHFTGKVDRVVSHQSKTKVVNSSITNVDVCSIASDQNHAFVNYLKVMNGVIMQTQTVELKKRLDESDAELLSLAISEIRSRFHSTSKEIIVPFALDVDTEDLRFAVPKQGEKRQLLDLSSKNALYYKKERLNH